MGTCSLKRLILDVSQVLVHLELYAFSMASVMKLKSASMLLTAGVLVLQWLLRNTESVAEAYLVGVWLDHEEEPFNNRRCIVALSWLHRSKPLVQVT